jgi:hypothetical protein
VDWARSRDQGGDRVIRHQLIQCMVADSAIDIAVNRTFVHQLAWEVGRGGDPRTLNAKDSMAKISATEAAGRVADRAVQIFGGRGYLRSNPVERIYRDVRVDRGEALVMFALKRLADAERDGDRVYAVIRGIGTSSDGRGQAIYAPVPEGQARALRRAYETAGYGPDTVELVEAHGTGTPAGDAAEFAALRTVFDESGRTDTASGARWGRSSPRSATPSRRREQWAC